MYTAKDIRNLALLGHGGDGKSALCASMLYVTKAITRLGKRADGTTVSDFDDEEKKRHQDVCHPRRIRRLQAQRAGQPRLL